MLFDFHADFDDPETVATQISVQEIAFVDILRRDKNPDAGELGAYTAWAIEHASQRMERPSQADAGDG